MYTLASLHQLRQRLGLDADDTADDTRLLAALQAASAQIEATAGRRFSPRYATLQHSVGGRSPSELLLEDDLLELVALTNGDGSAIDVSAVVMLPDTGGDAPVGVLRLTGGAVFVWDETPLRAVSVTGIWGWHDRWTRAWRDSGDSVQDNPLGASATTLTVGDTDGADGHGVAPRFQVGQLLRVEEEYVRVLAVDAAANVLTVLRGQGGTTAASHAQGTAIAVYQPAWEVQMLALRWAAWLYREPDARASAGVPSHLVAQAVALRRVGVKA